MVKAKKHKLDFQKREQLAFARGVRKGRKLGWDEGWDSAIYQRDQQDEHAVLALASIPPKPRETLAPEAIDLEIMDPILDLSSQPAGEAAYFLPPVVRRFTEPLRFN